MKTLFLALFVLTRSMLAMQANIGIPNTPEKAASKECHAEAKVLPDGSISFKDCSGVTTVVPKKSVTPAPRKETVPAPAIPSSAPYSDPETNAKYQKSLQSGFEYAIFSNAHAQRTFEWQYFSGTIIFWVVLALVGSGLLFSAIQFYLGMHRSVKGSRGPTKSDKDEPREESASEFEATLQGIKLKSSVLGLIILAMSMVFFFLYLKFVYPITNIMQ